MSLVDSHCHLHDSEFYDDEMREDVYRQTIAAGVTTMICIGTDLRSSREAVEFAGSHDGVYATVGVHPHEASRGIDGIEQLLREGHKKIVGIGEIGLDYFYEHSSREQQREALRAQLELARQYGLSVSFHVRDAVDKDGRLRGEVFKDFWPLLDEFPGVRGVLHSFTDSQANADEAIKRGLFIGINGICTFTRDEAQQQLYRGLPLSKILLETDAPFLTPKPFRGKMNIPAYVGRVAEFQAELRHVPLDLVIRETTANAKKLFGI